MTSEERKKEISKIKSLQPIATGTQLRYKGETKSFDVYSIPLELLAYNVDNGRISSLVKSYIKERGGIDPTKSVGAKIIERFLFQSNEERNKKTRQDLIDNGQLEFGIITADGVIVDGNRRASLLKSISEDKTLPQSVRDRCKYFKTRILPEDADYKEILRLETTYQMSTDSKVDYNPIEKYLHAYDMKERGFTLDEIKNYMGFKNSGEVTTTLDILSLIDEYLETYGYDGIYTRMPKGFEDDMLKLNQTIKSIRNGGNKFGWIQQDEIDEVITDLKAICFDFIRLNAKGDFDFRMISYTSSGNILQNRETWEKFVEKYNDMQEKLKDEEDVDSVLSKATNDKETRGLLDKRDNKWRKQVEEPLMDAFKECKDIVESKKEANKPAVLISKARNSLETIDKSSIFSSPQKETLLKDLQDIVKLINGLIRE